MQTDGVIGVGGDGGGERRHVAKGGEMSRKLLGFGLGLALSTLAVAVVPTMAWADSTCYTGCSAPTGGGVGNPPTVSVSKPASVPIQAPASSGLAFTGADIEGMTAVGVGAVVVGARWSAAVGVTVG